MGRIVAFVVTTTRAIIVPGMPPRPVLPLVLVGSSLMAQTLQPVQILNGANHDHYLFNGTRTVDTRDTSMLPHDFYWANANTNPPVGTPRNAPWCTIVENPGTNYVPPTVLKWWQYPPPDPMTSVEGAEPYATTGEYYQSEYFSHPSATITGFSFQGQFSGQHVTSTNDGYYTQAAYFSDRECFDGGTEYGWFHQPVNSGSLDQPGNQLYFYYSEFTNCGYLYVCSPDDQYADAVTQPTNLYLVTFNSLNSKSPNPDYEWIFRVLRCPAAGCPGVANSSNAFAITITDPYDLSRYAQCSVTGPTNVYFAAPGLCYNVTVAIANSKSFPAPQSYPGISVTNSWYITFADQSSTIFLKSTNYNCCGPPPVGNVVPTKVNGYDVTQYPELYVKWAYVLYEDLAPAACRIKYRPAYRGAGLSSRCVAEFR